MTEMDYLDLFMKDQLSIDLLQATDEELQRLDETLPIRWCSGNSFLELKHYAEKHTFAYKNSSYVLYHVDKKREGTISITVHEFVDAVHRKFSVTEDEICDLLR